LIAITALTGWRGCLRRQFAFHVDRPRRAEWGARSGIDSGRRDTSARCTTRSHTSPASVPKEQWLNLSLNLQSDPEMEIWKGDSLTITATHNILQRVPVQGGRADSRARVHHDPAHRDSGTRAGR
jgi:hypothetical protein